MNIQNTSWTNANLSQQQKQQQQKKRNEKELDNEKNHVQHFYSML